MKGHWWICDSCKLAVDLIRPGGVVKCDRCDRTLRPLPKAIEQIAEEVSEWSEATFPDDGLEPMLTKLDEEFKELSEAISAYLGPWSDLDGPFYPENATRIGDSRRLDILNEIADNVFVLVRMAHYLGADFREILENKWNVVRVRDYSRKLEPKKLSGDKRTIIERSSSDKKFVIFWDVGVGFYLVAGDPSPEGLSLPHWTSKNEGYATKFDEAEAVEWLRSGRMIGPDGEVYNLSSVALKVLEVAPTPEVVPEHKLEGYQHFLGRIADSAGVSGSPTLDEVLAQVRAWRDDIEELLFLARQLAEWVDEPNDSSKSTILSRHDGKAKVYVEKVEGLVRKER
ncbi:MAG: hypothetical protein ABL984_00500 [Pyrinomonadaceae bacterium]